MASIKEVIDAHDAEDRQRDADLAAVRVDLDAARNALGVVTAERDQARDERDAARDERATVQAAFDTHMATEHAPPPTKPIIGMSAPRDLWASRLAEVGADGVKARRIFCDLTSTGRDQSDLIAQAVSANMLPVLSYKLPRDASGNYRITEALSGSFDSWVTALGTYLAGLNVPVAVVFHHEPRGDLTPAEFIALNKRYLPLVKSERVKVGCFINGWLLDGSADRKAEFASFTDAALLDALDWFGIDAYHEGTPAAPNATKTPAARMRLTREWIDARGHADKPIGFGEYNGHTAQAVAEAGEAALSIPGVWFSCVWNSTAGEYVPLSGDRLEAFKATKGDVRAAK